jgi:Transposase
MRKSRFSEAQIAEMLKEGESGVPINDLIRKHGISRPTYLTGGRSTAAWRSPNSSG